jgi:hypothetical protein
MSAFDLLFTNTSFADPFSAPVIYRRDALEGTVAAMDSRISTEQQIEFGASLIVEAREWVIAISELALFGEPERGDEIQQADGSIWQLAQVGSAPDWEYDSDRNYYRLRTVLIGGV